VGAVWYQGGLAFECRRCGRCCGGEPGYVWVGADEIRALAESLHMTPRHFLAAYCRKALGRISLRERADGDCVLLSPGGCTAYAARPAQCRTFPFWPEHLASPESWARLGPSCPGVGRGRVHGAEEIAERLSGSFSLSSRSAGPS